jgi:spermidine/putrescine transport system permease protein
MQNMKKQTRSVLIGINNIPMLNAEIVTGISLMLLFISLGVKFGFMTILLAHITFNIPYVILSVMPRMKQLNPSTYEAALDLGASQLQAFFKVVFPDLLPGILSGFLMAFTMSLDDFIITHFTKGPGIDTLSTKIYTEVKKGIKPEMYALSTLIFIAVLVLLFLSNYIPKKKSAKATAILSYLTALGLFIALISGDKKGAKFHINLSLVIYLFSLIGLVPLFMGFHLIGLIWMVLMSGCWLFGLISAIAGVEKPIPVIGNIRILK